MERENKRISAWGGFLIGVLLTAVLFSVIGAVRRGEDKETKVLSLIDQFALTDADAETIEEGKYDGIMAALGDPYAAYYTVQETNAVEEHRSGTFIGLGLTYVRDEESGTFLVVDLYPKSAAAEAGFRAGDRIVSVDGIAPDELPDADLSAYVQAHLTDELVFRVRREDAADPIEVRVTPGPVIIPEVLYRKNEDGTGYLRILRFVKTTQEQFADALRDLESQGVTGIVIDLRANPGGLLDSVSGCLGEFLPEGLLFYTVEKDGTRKDHTTEGGDLLKVPAVLLIDGSTASSAEIFAGACRDRAGIPTVGVTTFGKGIVQTTHFLDDGSSIKFTSAHYYTPNGTDINGTGIVPDVECAFAEGAVMDASEADNQYMEALRVLKEETDG